MRPDELRALADMVEKGEAYAKCELVVFDRESEQRTVGGDDGLRVLVRHQTKTVRIEVVTYGPWTDEEEEYERTRRMVDRLGRRRGGETDGLSPWNTDHWRNR